MNESILTTTKKSLGLTESYEAFDSDVLLWINSAFSTLRDLGLGSIGFSVIDKDQTWDMFGEDLELTPMIKTYVFLRTKIMFDPPPTSFVMSAMQAQIDEQAFRLGTAREGRDWQPPPEPEEVEL